MHCIFNAYGRSRQIVATKARSVWVKVEYRRPFPGGSIGNHAQLSPTPSATTFNFLRTTLSCEPVLERAVGAELENKIDMALSEASKASTGSNLLKYRRAVRNNGRIN